MTPRAKLVDAAIQLLRDRNIVLVRAPPQAGKSTLAALIGRKILMAHPDLEPISFCGLTTDMTILIRMTTKKC